MNKVNNNRFTHGGYVDVPFARDLERMGDKMAAAINALVGKFEPGRSPQEVQGLADLALEASAEWRNYKPSNVK